MVELVLAPGEWNKFLEESGKGDPFNGQDWSDDEEKAFYADVKKNTCSPRKRSPLKKKGVNKQTRQSALQVLKGAEIGRDPQGYEIMETSNSRTTFAPLLDNALIHAPGTYQDGKVMVEAPSLAAGFKAQHAVLVRHARCDERKVKTVRLGSERRPTVSYHDAREGWDQSFER